MTHPMTTPRTALEECLRLAELATPGLWRFSDNGNIVPEHYTQDCEICALYANDANVYPNAFYIVALNNLLRTHGKDLSEALGGWEPIETAPKDGAEVLLWLRAPYSRAALASWFEPWSMWVEFEGEDDDSPGGIGSLVPTHWQPITPPTSAKGSEAEG